MSETCDGCRYMTSQALGCGSTQYGCELHPGLCTGDRGIDSDPKYDEPLRCEKYEVREVQG
jgi:hypothetical protein